jgi:hypothetical protein
VVLAMTLLGPRQSASKVFCGPIARALLEASAAVSSRLGYRP